MNNIRSYAKYILFVIIALLLLSYLAEPIMDFFSSNKSNTTTTTPVIDDTPRPEVKTPKFDRDSAYTFISKQVSFGPRVTNSKGHKECKNWLVGQFKKLGADVIEQNFTAQAYTGTTLNGTNIIASYNKANPKRILLAAHWDTRHISDQDADTANHDKPVLGADDGASGVGILLEVARTLQTNMPNVGVDIILFDAEDYGGGEDMNSWCLGSQHWSRNPHIAGYKAEFGILLDMVGGRNARFTKDGTSMRYAGDVMDKVWRLAKDIGYENYFQDVATADLIDDHLFVNQLNGTKMIDIINRPSDSSTGFPDHWHTQHDDMDNIDYNTLRAVGQTILSVIFYEAADAL